MLLKISSFNKKNWPTLLGRPVLSKISKRDSLHRASAASAAGRRPFSFFGAFAAVHFAFTVHFAGRSTFAAHRTALHSTTLHSTTLRGAARRGRRTALHRASTSAGAGTSLRASTSASAASGSGGSLSKSSSAYTKCTGGGQEQFGDFHGDIKLMWGLKIASIVVAIWWLYGNRPPKCY